MSEIISIELLEKYKSYEKVDNVPKEPDTTEFKRRARFHQSKWREQNGYPIGSHPYKDNGNGRVIGSRINFDFAKDNMVNFLSENAKSAVIKRLSNPEPKQTMNEYRLYSDCLSSMPMCFNLFGIVSDDMISADQVVKNWWPNTPGKVMDLKFEWSPGRQLAGRFLENRSAFDCAFELELENGNRGVIGIETKYHEDCRKEGVPSDERIKRYKLISDKSQVFKEGYLDMILGTELQQIWQDHILALSMLQDDETNWDWAKFILVYPEKNPSFERAAQKYRQVLRDDATFDSCTIEYLLSKIDDKVEVEKFRKRYIW